MSIECPATDARGQPLETGVEEGSKQEELKVAKVSKKSVTNNSSPARAAGESGAQDVDQNDNLGQPRRRRKKRKIPGELTVSGGWICRVSKCGRVSSDRRLWWRHDGTHLPKEICHYCGLKVGRMRDHVQKKHPGLEDEEEDQWTSGFLQETSPDRVKGPRKRMFQYSEDRDEQGMYVCRWEDCGLLFPALQVYSQHIYSTHGASEQMVRQRRRAECELCGKLITRNNMKQHIRSVHTHRDERNYQCEECDKKFKYRSELQLHQTVHSGELNFQCNGCFKRFRRSAEARLCEKAHLGIFSFACDVCDYKTNKKNHLDRHLDSHVKATPFVCPVCSFQSGRKDNLKQHMQKRHCGGDVTIESLEQTYHDLYKAHENLVPIVKTKKEAHVNKNAFKKLTEEPSKNCTRKMARESKSVGITRRRIEEEEAKLFEREQEKKFGGLEGPKARSRRPLVKLGQPEEYSNARHGESGRLCDKRYQCGLCEYKTSRPSHLARHDLSHRKKTGFVCPICNLRCKRRVNLQQHMERKHVGGEAAVLSGGDLASDEDLNSDRPGGGEQKVHIEKMEDSS